VEGEMGEGEREDTPDPELSQASLAVNCGHLYVPVYSSERFLLYNT
jgi:hypothetical protein